MIKLKGTRKLEKNELAKIVGRACCGNSADTCAVSRTYNIQNSTTSDDPSEGGDIIIWPEPSGKVDYRDCPYYFSCKGLKDS